MRAASAFLKRAAFAACTAVIALGHAGAASATSLDFDAIDAKRKEHKRASSSGKTPLIGTPDLKRLEERLAEQGVALGAPLFIRVFKAEMEMEVWTGDEEGNYKLFATYPICYFSGKLGPKLKEGDKQAPEGFYTVSLGQSRHKGRWPRSLNIGFPNPFDQINMRSGSHILIHGGCASVGCFAMTNAVNEEIHKLSTAALEAGQPHLHIHSFPFRMTDENMASHDMPQWHAFWQNLKEGYDLFERTKRPPRVSVCGDRYSFAAASRVEGVNTGSIVVCPDTAEVIASLRSINKRVAEQSTVVAGASTAEIKTASIVTPTSYFASAATTGVAANRLGENFELQLAPETPRKGVSETLTRPLPCSLALPSCRKYASLREQVAHKTALRAEEPERAKARAPKKKKKSSKKRNRRKSSNRQASAYDSGVREYREVVSAPSGRDWREVKMSSYQ